MVDPNAKLEEELLFVPQVKLLFGLPLRLGLIGFIRILINGLM
jgi:hypothetical protein